MTTAAISQRELPAAELEERLVAALRRRKGTATEADLVVESGVPPHQLGPALRELLTLYRSHLDVTEAGDLVYRFDPAMVRRDAQRFAVLRQVGRAAWAMFRVFYKVMIAVVLVAYFVAFVVLLLAALAALSRGGGSRDDRRSDHGGGLDGMFFWYWMFGRGPHGGYGRTYRTGRDRASVPFYKKVVAFVFGPEKTPADELEDERELLAYIRARGGVITPTDLVSRTGWPLDAAEQESTRLLARYGGDVEVTDEGAILYTFKDLMTTAGASDSRPAPAFWETWERPQPLTGNGSGSNAGIGILNAFVLVSSFALMPTFIAPALGLSLAAPPVLVGLVLVPGIYATLFFAIPFLRWLLAVRPDNHRRAARNLRRVILREAFRGVPVEPTRVAEQIPAGIPVPQEAAAAIERTVAHVAAELDGDTDVSADGRVSFRFPRIAEEREAADRRRAGGSARLIHVGEQAIAFSSAH